MEQTKVKQIGAESEPVGTPSTSRSEGKREATSPLDVQDLLKKTRHKSLEAGGDTSLQAEPIGEAIEVDLQSNTDEPVHLLSQPINPLDIVRIATELRSMMLPELQKLITDMIPFIKTIVKEAVTEATGTLNDEVRKLKEDNENINKANSALEKRLSQVEYDNDALEQYSRRNSVRISGINEAIDEDTDSIVMRLAEKLDVTLSPADIDRSHRVGRTNEQGRDGRRRHRDILVKFSTYNARRRLFMKRKDLRDSEDTKHIFINEDLTTLRSRLLYDARCLVRTNKLNSAYASDGKIFVRDKDDHRRLIKYDSDILEYGDPKEARNELTRRSRLVPSASASASST